MPLRWPANFYNRDEKDVLLDLIYMSNSETLAASYLRRDGTDPEAWYTQFLDRPEKIDKADITFIGSPQFLDQRTDLDYDPNSFIKFKLKKDLDIRYVGANGFMYRRTPLAEITLNRRLLNVTFPTSVYELLPLINAQFKMRLTEKDVFNEVFQEFTSVIPMKAKPNSMLYIGKTTMGYSLDMILEPYLLGFNEYIAPATP